MTRPEELVLQTLPIAVAVVGVALLVGQCSSPLSTFPSERLGIDDAERQIEATTSYRVHDCRYVRRRSYDVDDVSCRLAGRCDERITFEVARDVSYNSEPIAQPILRRPLSCP